MVTKNLNTLLGIAGSLSYPLGVAFTYLGMKFYHWILIPGLVFVMLGAVIFHQVYFRYIKVSNDQSK